ncbi:hypothetical protein ACEPAI_9250 [Sanghuangporus weigelae]
MSPANLNLTSLAANAVVPTTGSNYQVVNLGFGHTLDNANGGLSDGNAILSWSQNSPETSNQIWSFLTYPSSDGSTVFTLQSLSTVQSGSGAVVDGRGGFMRVDPSTNRVVQSGAPQAWKLIEVAPSVYKMTPFESIFSNSGRLVATDMSSGIHDQTTNQLQIQQDVTALQQLWTFN